MLKGQSEPAWKDSHWSNLGQFMHWKKKKRIVFDSRIFNCYILESIKDTKKKMENRKEESLLYRSMAVNKYR